MAVRRGLSYVDIGHKASAHHIEGGAQRRRNMPEKPVLQDSDYRGAFWGQSHGLWYG